MSGHNKWSQIKRKKGVIDEARAKVFGRLSKIIALESKTAKGDVNSPSLRAIIEKAKGESMPKENIERAIKNGMGRDHENVEEIVYEAYGPGGAALIIQTITGNRNKASAEVKHILSKNDSSLGAIGSAVWAFEKTEGEWRAKTPLLLGREEAEKLFVLIEALEENEEVSEVFTNAEPPEGFSPEEKENKS